MLDGVVTIALGAYFKLFFNNLYLAALGAGAYGLVNKIHQRKPAPSPAG